MGDFEDFVQYQRNASDAPAVAAAGGAQTYRPVPIAWMPAQGAPSVPPSILQTHGAFPYAAPAVPFPTAPVGTYTAHAPLASGINTFHMTNPVAGLAMTFPVASGRATAILDQHAPHPQHLPQDYRQHVPTAPSHLQSQMPEPNTAAPATAAAHEKKDARPKFTKEDFTKKSRASDALSQIDAFKVAVQKDLDLHKVSKNALPPVANVPVAGLYGGAVTTAALTAHNYVGAVVPPLVHQQLPLVTGNRSAAAYDSSWQQSGFGTTLPMHWPTAELGNVVPMLQQPHLLATDDPGGHHHEHASFATHSNQLVQVHTLGAVAGGSTSDLRTTSLHWGELAMGSTPAGAAPAAGLSAALLSGAEPVHHHVSNGFPGNPSSYAIATAASTAAILSGTADTHASHSLASEGLAGELALASAGAPNTHSPHAAAANIGPLQSQAPDDFDDFMSYGVPVDPAGNSTPSLTYHSTSISAVQPASVHRSPPETSTHNSSSSSAGSSLHSPVATPRRLVVPPLTNKSNVLGHGVVSHVQSKTKRDMPMHKIGVIFKKFVDPVDSSLYPARSHSFHSDTIGASNIGNQNEPVGAADQWNGFASASTVPHGPDLGSAASADSDFGDFQSLPASVVTTNMQHSACQTSSSMSDTDLLSNSSKHPAVQHPVPLAPPKPASPGFVTSASRMGSVPVAATNIVRGVSAMPGDRFLDSSTTQQSTVQQIGAGVGQSEDTYDDFVAFQSFVPSVETSAQHENSDIALVSHGEPGFTAATGATAAAGAAAAAAAAAAVAAAHPKQSSKAADWSMLSDLNEFSIGSSKTDLAADGSLFLSEPQAMKNGMPLDGTAAATTAVMGHEATTVGDAAAEGFADFAAFQQDVLCNGAESSWHATSVVSMLPSMMPATAYDDDGDWGSFLGPADKRSGSSIAENGGSSFDRRPAAAADQGLQNGMCSAVQPPSLVAVPAQMESSAEASCAHDTVRSSAMLANELTAVPHPVRGPPTHEVTSLMAKTTSTAAASTTAGLPAKDVNFLDDRYDSLQPPPMDDYVHEHDDIMGPPPLGLDAYDHDEVDIAFGSFTSFGESVKAATVRDQSSELVFGKGSSTSGAKASVSGSMHVTAGSPAIVTAAYPRDNTGVDVRPTTWHAEESMPNTNLVHVQAKAADASEPVLASLQGSPAVVVVASAASSLDISTEPLCSVAEVEMPQSSPPLGVGATWFSRSADDIVDRHGGSGSLGATGRDFGSPLLPATAVLSPSQPLSNSVPLDSSDADFAPFSAFSAEESEQITESSVATGIAAHPKTGGSSANAAAFATLVLAAGDGDADVDAHGYDDGGSGSWGFASSPPPLPASSGPGSESSAEEDDWGFTRTAARDDAASPASAERHNSGWEEFHEVASSGQVVTRHTIDKGSSSEADAHEADAHRSVCASTASAVAGRHDSWDDLHAVTPSAANEHSHGLSDETFGGDPAVLAALDPSNFAITRGHEAASATSQPTDWFSSKKEGDDMSAADWASDWAVPSSVLATDSADHLEWPGTPSSPPALADVSQTRDPEHWLAGPEDDDDSWEFGAAHLRGHGPAQVRPLTAKTADIPGNDNFDDDEDDDWTFSAVAPKTESSLPPVAVNDDWVFPTSAHSSTAATARSAAGAAAVTTSTTTLKETSTVLPQATTLKILQIAFAASAAIQWASLAVAAAGLPRPVSSSLSDCRLWMRLCDLDSSPAMTDMVWSSSTCCSRMLDTLPLAELSSVAAGPQSRAVGGRSPLGAESPKERHGGLLMPVMLAPTRALGSGGSNGGSNSGSSGAGISSRSGSAPSLATVLPTWEQPSSSAEVSVPSLDSDWMFVAPVAPADAADAVGAPSAPAVPFDLDFLESVTSVAAAKPSAAAVAEQSSARNSMLPPGLDLSFFEALSVSSSSLPRATTQAGAKRKS